MGRILDALGGVFLEGAFLESDRWSSSPEKGKPIARWGRKAMGHVGTRQACEGVVAKLPQG